MTSGDDIDETPLIKGLIGLVVGLIAVGVLAAMAYFGSNADRSTTGRGEHSSLSQPHAPPPGAVGR
jgi:hypothetical protein